MLTHCSLSFDKVLSVIFPNADDKLKMKLSDEVEDKHDKNKDSTLQLDEFAAFMWDNAPKKIRESQTMDQLVHGLRDWLKGIRKRAASANFKTLTPDPTSSQGISRSTDVKQGSDSSDNKGSVTIGNVKGKIGSTFGLPLHLETELKMSFYLS